MTKAEYKTRIRELETELRVAKNRAADALLKLETIRVALGPADAHRATFTKIA